MEQYNDMFYGYNQSLEKTKQNYKDSTNENLYIKDEGAKDKQLLYSLIKQYNDDSGESGSFFGFISAKFKSKASLLAFLKRVRGLIDNSSLLEAIEGMINSLENSSQKEEAQANKNEKQISQPLTDPVQASIMATKYREYSLFAVAKSQNKNHFPTERSIVNTTSFKNLSRNELVKNFQADKFYSLTSTQKQALFQAVADEYLSSYGVEPCAVNLVDLPISDKSVCFGQYNPNTGSISINKNLLANIDSADEANNQYLPYQILSTIIHEARHRVQFSMLNDKNLSDKERLVVNSLMHPQENMSYNSYLAEPDELDARNEALAYIRQVATSQQGTDNSLAQFYNLTKENEMQNSKSPVSPKVMENFPDIYENTYLRQGQNYNRMQQEKREFSQIIRGNYQSLELAKRFEIKKPY